MEANKIMGIISDIKEKITIEEDLVNKKVENKEIFVSEGSVLLDVLEAKLDVIYEIEHKLSI